MEAKLKRRKNARAALVRAALWACVLFTAGVFLLLVAYVLVRGVPNLRLSMFSPTYTTENLSMLPAILNTLTMTGVTLLIAVPLGVGAAIYLTEYAKPGNRLVPPIRLTTETLAGIPSIVYGLFGYLVFVKALHLRLSLLSGALTLAIMILPTIMRTTEEALRSIPQSYREASFGLGAGRLRTVFVILLPTALPGILGGVLLSVGRIVGETAALIYTAGTVAKIAGLTDGGRTLAVHMYALIGEGLYTDAAYATAVVLLAVVILLNALSDLLLGKHKKGDSQ